MKIQVLHYEDVVQLVMDAISASFNDGASEDDVIDKYTEVIDDLYFEIEVN